jgi:hypothetical protein
MEPFCREDSALLDAKYHQNFENLKNILAHDWPSKDMINSWNEKNNL